MRRHRDLLFVLFLPPIVERSPDATKRRLLKVYHLTPSFRSILVRRPKSSGAIFRLEEVTGTWMKTPLHNFGKKYLLVLW
jgi:hypothetical protein